MAISILKLGGNLIASIQSSVSDDDLDGLRTDLARQVGEHRSRGVIVDVTNLDLMDSFTVRTLLDIGQIGRLRGAETVIVGVQPEVALTMARLGLAFEGVSTALDLEEAVAVIQGGMEGGGSDGH